MSYDYEKLKADLFTDEGQRFFLKVRDYVKKLLLQAGAFRAEKVLALGDNWKVLACLDRMVELKEICEVDQRVETVGQHRIYVEAW